MINHKFRDGAPFRPRHRRQPLEQLHVQLVLRNMPLVKSAVYADVETFSPVTVST